MNPTLHGLYYTILGLRHKIPGLFFTLLLCLSVNLNAATWEWDDGGSTDDWSNQNQAKYYENWNPDSNPYAVGGENPTILFGNAVSSDQTITIKGGDKTVYQVLFDSTYQYTIEGQGSPALVFDSGSVGGNSLLGVAGTANQVINVKITAANDLTLSQDTTNTITLKKEVNIGDNEFIVDTDGTVYIENKLSGTGDLVKRGTGILYLQNRNASYSGTTTIEDGILRIQENDSLGEGITISSGGTLSLDGANTAGGGIKLPNDLYLSGSGYNNSGALQSYAGNNKIEGSITLNNDATIRTESGATLTIEQGISGANKNLTFSGPGAVKLEAQNTYSGATIVDQTALTLDVTQTLKNTSDVILQNGGTIIMRDEQAINQQANMTLAGGTFVTGGHNQTLQTLTLSADSTINVGGSDSRVEFSDLVYTEGVVLTIAEYAHHEDYIIISSTVSEEFLQNVFWEDQGIWGAIQTPTGRIVPYPPPFVVPEPSTYLTGIAGLLLISLRYFRKIKSFFT